jgi:sigma-B regulation protein RsbU (phosphoserine phosphatase)
VTIIAPVTRDLLVSLVPGLGEVNFLDFRTPSSQSLLPAPMNFLDLHVRWPYPVYVASWEAPQSAPKPYLMVVDTRYSAVLAIVFGQTGDWSELAMTLLIALVGLFLMVEIASLWAGIKLTRSITGAVHELYEGTRHVREGDFNYRIPVKGEDQLGELGISFNTMTENLGRLVIVAKEKERLESELTIAREVQNQLFPKDAPTLRTLELRGVCHPARMVSGDYYDFMPLPGDVLAFAIGDVAGKGISAALLMAAIQSTMRTQLNAVNGTGPHKFSAAALVATLNRQLYATTSPEKYATFYFALYDETTHALTYTNAGHLAPILVRDSGCEMLDSTGTVVGAFPIARYEERTVTLGSGDLVLAYTDGITEPENVYGEMFGEERLKDLAVKYAKTDSAELIARTMEAVVEWTGAGELQDDMTMVVARRL